jgi:tetratricopeptide (TPR) repeat protein
MSQRPQPERPATVQLALESAVAALHARDAAEAERLASYVLKSAPGHALAAKTLGQALLMQDRADEAVAPLRRSAKRCKDPETETLLGRALAGAGRSEEALAALRLAISRRPAFVLAFLELGEQLGQLGRLDEAARALEEGLVLAPEALPLRMALAHLSLSRNDRPSARRLFDEVRRAAPHRHDAILGLAHVLAMDGDYAQAAALCREALALRPDDAMTQIELARCLLEQGDRSAAEAILRAATRGGAQLVGTALVTLASAARGRLFLRPSDALRFLKGASGAEAPAIDPALAADFA